MCSSAMPSEDRRLDHGRRDAVDEHAGARDVLADRLRHRDHRRLGRRVGGRHRVSLLARDRRDVDDPAVAALDHARQDGAVAEEHAVGVDRHHAAPLLVRHVDRRERRAGDRRPSRRARRSGRAPASRGRRRPRPRRESETSAGQREARPSGGSPPRSSEATARALAERAARAVAAPIPLAAAGDQRDATGKSMIVGHGRAASLSSARDGCWTRPPTTRSARGDPTP